MLAMLALLVPAADLAALPRTIAKEPAYVGKPQYLLLAFGPTAAPVWVVRDGRTLYVDRNGDGDLTSPTEKTAAKPGREVAFTVPDVTVGGRTHQFLDVTFAPAATRGPATRADPAVKAALAADPDAMVVWVGVEAAVPGVTGSGAGGRVSQMAENVLTAPTPAAASVVHFAGPWRLTLESVYAPHLDRSAELRLNLGTPGVGPNTFAGVEIGAVPDGLHPTATIRWPGVAPQTVSLAKRCCGWRFYDKVTPPTGAKAGDAAVSLAYDSWPAGRVTAATEKLTVRPAAGRPSNEPVTPRLVRSISTASKRDTVGVVAYRPDGKELFAAGYGYDHVLQFLDPATGRETRRIDPQARPISFRYAGITADWAQVFCFRSKVAVVRYTDAAGRRQGRAEYDDAVRVWDATSGRERPELPLPDKRHFAGQEVSPDGRFTAVLEKTPFQPGTATRGVLVVWDVAKKARREVSAEFASARFRVDGKRLLVVPEMSDSPAPKRVRLVDPADGTELASTTLPADVSSAFPVGFFADGTVAVAASRDKLPPKLLVLNADTLKPVAEITDPPLADGTFVGFQSMFLYGRPAADGRTLAVAFQNGVRVWDVPARKLVREFVAPAGRRLFEAVVSPDGNTAAAIGQTFTANVAPDDDDPANHAQPRVYLIPLAGGAVEECVLPPGFCGQLAFAPDGRSLAVGSSGAIHLLRVGR